MKSEDSKSQEFYIHAKRNFDRDGMLYFGVRNGDTLTAYHGTDAIERPWCGDFEKAVEIGVWIKVSKLKVRQMWKQIQTEIPFPL